MRRDHERELAALREQVQQMRYALATAMTALLVRPGRIEDTEEAKARLRKSLPREER